MKIQGEKVNIRPAKPEDRRKIYKWLTQSNITSKMMGPPHYTDHPIPTWKQFCTEYQIHFFDGSQENISRSFIIYIDHEDIGHINYDGMDLSRSLIELDIWLKSMNYCGQGFGTDALKSLIQYLYNRFGIENFVIRPSARNQNAIRSYEKAGFEKAFIEKEEQERQYGPGDYQDTLLMIKKWK